NALRDARRFGSTLFVGRPRINGARLFRNSLLESVFDSHRSGQDAPGARTPASLGTGRARCEDARMVRLLPGLVAALSQHIDPMRYCSVSGAVTTMRRVVSYLTVTF